MIFFYLDRHIHIIHCNWFDDLKKKTLVRKEAGICTCHCTEQCSVFADLSSLFMLHCF